VTKIAGSQSVPVGGKTAFGRPFKRRYSHLFYRKQQLRFFHGKVQERTFCHSFQKHYISVSKHTRIFFNSIESRLDIYFFRIRVFPTIFACHQLIFHQGVEVNEGVERAPSFVVRVGDMISISSIM
jgi:ribosomal protein S4